MLSKSSSRMPCIVGFILFFFFFGHFLCSRIKSKKKTGFRCFGDEKEFLNEVIGDDSVEDE